MKSPISGKEMERRTEPDFPIRFRKEEFSIVHHYWFCADSREQFTDESMDQLDLDQVYNQYREKYGIPFPEEIRAIREKYGLSASKMSEILGLGANSWRNYEAGEVPSVANGRLMLAIRDPQDFIRQVEASAPVLSQKELENILKQVHQAALAEAAEQEKENQKVKVFHQKRPDQFTGYRVPDVNRAGQMVIFFAQAMPDLFKTKLNKLLFYADFMAFSRRGKSISGMSYRAIEFGPVPADYDKLLVRLMEDDQIQTREKTISGTDFTGETVVPRHPVDFRIFTPEEQAVLEEVAKRFSGLTTRQIVELCHHEPAWKANVAGKSLVSYGKWGYLLNPNRP